MARSKDPALKKARCELIADTAITVLSEVGWKVMTLSGVAKRAGVSKGVVTYWFASKDLLILAALDRFHERYQQRLFSLAQEDKPVRSRLRDLLEVAFPSHQVLQEELNFHVEILSYAKEHPEAKQKLLESYKSFQNMCEWMLQLGVEEGYVKAEKIEGLYLFIHALIDGLTMRLAYAPEHDLVEIREQLFQLLEKWLCA